MDEKPLHVRVAEVLGWSDLKAMELVPSGIAQWWGKPPDDWVRQNGLFVGDIDREGRRVTLTPNYGLVPRYDTDWSATGPLIVLYGIDLYRREKGTRTPYWRAILCGDASDSGDDDEPLVAVCRAIIAAAEQGRLMTAREQDFG